MRLISSYRVFYSIIVMGSYSRSFLIASVVSLIGIGICLALEHRWRNMAPAPSSSRLSQSDRVLAKTTTSEEAKDNPQPSDECLPVDDDTPEDGGNSEEIQNGDNTEEIEDDVTVLFDPASSLSIYVKSTPGLLVIDIDHKNCINKQDDKQQSEMEDTLENIESCESCATLLNDVETEDNPSWIAKILEYVKLEISRDYCIEEVLIPNKETRESVINQILASTFEQDNDNHIRGNPDTRVDEKQECTIQNEDCLHLIKDYGEPKVDEELDNNPVEDSGDVHNLEQYTTEHTEDESVPPSINLYPTECFFFNVDTKDLKKTDIFKEKTVQNSEPTSPFAENHKSDIHPESQCSSLQEMNGLVDGKNNSILSGIGEFQCSPLEETRLALSVKESLEEACASISTVPQTPRNLENDSTVPAVTKEDAIRDNKFLQTRPIRNGLRYNEMVAVPKKTKMIFEVNSKESKEEKDDIAKTPKHYDKNRVRRLVGFFENKCEK